jgi:transglutaminase-like putative cysteine protease
MSRRDIRAMYSVKHFKISLYLLVLLGIAAFALAAQSPAVWFLATAAVSINAWLVATGRFKPLPRLVANLATVGGVVMLLTLVEVAGDTPIIIIGHFLVLLQVIKLYEQRGNRDYAQLVILSLLLQVASAISTANLLFGVLLAAYLVIGLYCSVLFHIKVEVERARHASSIPDDSPMFAGAGQDLAAMPRSMRRITVLLTVFALSGALLTFVFFPRGSNSGFFGAMQSRPGQMLTGFSDSVSFQNVARITQNSEPVARVRVTRGNQPFRGLLMLRGLTLDHYTGPGEPSEFGGRTQQYEWVRETANTALQDIAANSRRTFKRSTPAEEPDLYYQEVELYPTGTMALFSLPGIINFTPGIAGRYGYSRPDEVLQTGQVLQRKFSYDVTASGQLTVDPENPPQRELANPEHVPIDPRIEQYARRPEVSGTDEQGSLAARRPVDALVTPLDSIIASNIEKHLRSNFAYTLDLTEASRLNDQDPLVAFLYDFKRGHCEYFAGAMALMCQSLGMQARLVVGFMCDEYNPYGDYFMVRQSHAHAWVEVLNDHGGWDGYDPTSSRLDTLHTPTSFGQIAAVIDYVEYLWQTNVIGYDTDSRLAAIQQVDAAIGRGLYIVGEWTAWFRRFVDEVLPVVSLNIIGAAIFLSLAVLLIAIFGFLYERWRLRKRVQRIGLDALPESEQLLLARQLGFYDQLLLILERFRIVRPSHLTPLEFSQSLTFLPVEAFDAIRGLTDVFYRVRYGRQQLPVEERRHLAEVLEDVENALNPKP